MKKFDVYIRYNICYIVKSVVIENVQVQELSYQIECKYKHTFYISLTINSF